MYTLRQNVSENWQKVVLAALTNLELLFYSYGWAIPEMLSGFLCCFNSLNRWQFLFLS